MEKALSIYIFVVLSGSFSLYSQSPSYLPWQAMTQCRRTFKSFYNIHSFKCNIEMFLYLCVKQFSCMTTENFAMALIEGVLCYK